MVQIKQAVEPLKVLSHSTVHTLDKMLSDPTYSYLKSTPIFKNGHLVDVKSTTIVDYLRIKRRLRYDKNMVNSETFQHAVDAVGEVIKEVGNRDSIVENVKTAELAKTEVCNFLTQYAGERYEGRSGPFSRSIKLFRLHIMSELPFFTYITPLYNVRGNFHEIALSKNTKIRAITDREYIRIVDINKPLKNIEHHQKRLRLVIEHRADVKVRQPLNRR